MKFASATDLAIAIAKRNGTLKTTEKPSRLGGTYVAIEDETGIIEACLSMKEAQERIDSIVVQEGPMAVKNLNPLIDEFCELQTRINKDKKRYEALKKELLPHVNETTPLRSNKWCIVFTKTPVTNIDLEKLRNVVSERWLKRFWKTTERNNFKAVRLEI